MEEKRMGVPLYREKVTEILNTCYSNNLLEIEELERRLSLVQKAKFIEDLDLLIADAPKELIQPDSPAILKKTENGPLSFSQPEKKIMCIMGSRRLRSHNLEIQKAKVVTVMGEVILDFRGLTLPQEPITINVSTVMGSSQILVDPGTPVDFEVLTIMGDNQEKGNLKPYSRANGSGLIIKGICIMGEVIVSSKKGFIETIVEKL